MWWLLSDPKLSHDSLLLLGDQLGAKLIVPGVHEFSLVIFKFLVFS